MANLEIYERKIRELGMRNHYANATIELTSRCNARCDYCYIADNDSQDLPTEKVYTIIDKLADAGVMNLSLTGGEPFMRNDILDIVSYVIKKDFWTIGLFTNGTLITDEHIHFLCNHIPYIGLIQISAFSHIPEIHDSYIGIPGALKKSLQAGRQLKDAGLNVCFGINVLDVNYKTINETVGYFKKSGYSIKWGINKIITKDTFGERKQNRTRLEFSNSYNFYCSLLEHLPPSFLQSEKKRFQEKQKNRTPAEESLLCHGIITSICIDSKGYIRPCVSFRDMQIGSIFEKGTLYELVQKSDELKRIKSLRRSDLYKCKDCKYNNSCSICIGQIHTEIGCIDKPTKQLCNYAEAVESLSVF